MSDTALTNAKVRRDALAKRFSELEQTLMQTKAEINTIENDLVAVDEFIRAWHKFAGIEVPAMPSPETRVLDTSRRKKRVTTNPKKELVVRKVIEILRKNGKPMSRHDLFVALQNVGIHLQGKNPEMVLSTMLWRMPKKIVRLHPDGYWPTEDPYKPAEYEPEDEVSIESLLS